MCVSIYSCINEYYGSPYDQCMRLWPQDVNTRSMEFWSNLGQRTIEFDMNHTA